MRTKSPQVFKSKTKKVTSFKYFLLILPFLILITLFAYYPLFGWVYAFFDYRPPLRLAQTEFVGFKWFEYLFANKGQIAQLLLVMKNTLIMSSLTLMASVLPLIFAMFLNEIRIKKVRNFVQTMTTLPNFISWVLVYALADTLFSSSGLVNDFLMNVGITDMPIKFLDSGEYVYLKMILWHIWKGLGWGAILYLAAISAADQTLYEVAKVDGAHRHHLMWHITLPALLPTFFVLLLLSFANLLSNGMDQYFVFENAFNRDSIQVLDLYVYNLGIGSNDAIPLATAINMQKSLISLMLLFIVNGISKKLRGKSII